MTTARVICTERGQDGLRCARDAGHAEPHDFKGVTYEESRDSLAAALEAATSGRRTKALG